MTGSKQGEDQAGEFEREVTPATDKHEQGASKESSTLEELCADWAFNAN